MVQRILVAGLLLTGCLVHAQSPKPPAPANPLVERVGDTGFIQIQAESFRQLTPAQQALAYWLTQASIAIDPIIYDQLSHYGLRQKRLLEEIMGHAASVPPPVLKKIRQYALLFWASRGNHNENTSQKFLPTFTYEELQQAALQAREHGAFAKGSHDLSPLATDADIKREIADLRASIFDPAFEPMITAKTPPPGHDIIQASSNTFYRGVTLADLKSFAESHPLNSRVIKGPEGKLV